MSLILLNIINTHSHELTLDPFGLQYSAQFIVKRTKFLGDLVVQDYFGAKPCLRIQAVLDFNALMDCHQFLDLH